MTDPADLGVGHQEREATTTVLRTAAQEGRLTPEELAQRISSALDARTFADLDALVADLPVAPPPTGLRRTTTFDANRIGADSDHRLRLSGGMSSHVRRGGLVRPAVPRPQRRPGLGQARFPAGRVRP
ncbi:DUF1707 domain-containing protein [Lapillicoccus sp.]|uniref:DUF1707 SHOCT-like domain-containing protein n=1 Tax=Lapillicoccus sp. TaxID=1909287 RepID=UPI00398372BC